MSTDCIPPALRGSKFLENKPTGNYDEDCRTGEMLASGVLAHSIREKDPFLLGEVVRALVREPRYSGIEVGFFTTIGAALTEMRR